MKNKKGFAISGILYPILVLTLFLVVQMLFMLQTRKNVLDKARTELADTVNTSNQVYTNEELSALIGKLQDKNNDLESKISKLEAENESLKAADDKMRHYTVFTSSDKYEYTLKFENQTRGSILIFGSANSQESLTNIRFDTYNDNFVTEVNNQGAGVLKVNNFSCSNNICTMTINFSANWGRYLAISSSKFI